MSDIRIGLGCMRLSADKEEDDARAITTIREAVTSGLSFLDTAHAYRRDGADLGHSERLIATALGGLDPKVAANARVITKCGMRRSGAAWVPDGRGNAIAEDLAASREALGSVPIDVLLLHAPDPRVPLATSVRALGRAKEEKSVRAIGVSNVSLRQLEQAFALAPISAVEVPLGAFDDAAARGGVLACCMERAVVVFAHSPLGGPARAPRLLRDPVLQKIGHRLGATPIEVVLAYLLALSPTIVPLVGARRPETIKSSVAASRLVLDDEALETLDKRFPGLGVFRRPPVPPPSDATREVALLMGIPGAGKSDAVEAYVARGYERLNRDDLGGTLRAITRRLDERLRDGARRIVLDNTYVTRLARSEVIRVAHAHGARVSCLFFDTSLDDAKLNVVGRMLDRYGELLGPGAIRERVRVDANTIAPKVLFRMARDLEPPRSDEGFSAIEVIAFVRSGEPGSKAHGAAIALDAITEGNGLEVRHDAERLLARVPTNVPSLVFGWKPDADATFVERARSLVDRLARATGRSMELAVCPHAAGPPTCWCRPPLPGLWVAFARRHSLDVKGGVLVGAVGVHRTMARSLGMSYLVNGEEPPPSSTRAAR